MKTIKETCKKINEELCDSYLEEQEALKQDEVQRKYENEARQTQELIEEYLEKRGNDEGSIQYRWSRWFGKRIKPH